jgi:hypothetical protein
MSLMDKDITVRFLWHKNGIFGGLSWRTEDLPKIVMWEVESV